MEMNGAYTDDFSSRLFASRKLPIIGQHSVQQPIAS